MAATIATLTAVVLICALRPQAAHAQQALSFETPPTLGGTASTASVRAGIAHSDNVNLTQFDRISDTIASLGIDLNAHRVGPELRLDGDGSVDWNDYLGGAYRSLPFGTLRGGLLWGTTADVLQFAARDTFTQASSNPYATATPNTIENLNVLTAGPALNVHLGADTRFTVYGFYTKTTYQSSELNSQEYTGGIDLWRKVSAIASLSLNASDEYVHYQDEANPNFRVKQVSTKLLLVGARTVITAQAGYNQVEEQGQRQGGPLFHLDLVRVISGSTSVSARLRQEFVSSADLVGGGGLVHPGVAPTIGVNSPIATASPFRDRSVELSWDFNRPRTSFRFSGAWDDEQYTSTAQYNREVLTVLASATRRLSPTMSLSLRVSFAHERFATVDIGDNQTNFAIQWAKALGPRTSLAVYAEQFKRSGFSANDYTDHVFGLRVVYSLLGPLPLASLF